MSNRKVFGERSLKNLAGVKPGLQALAKRALELSPHDFTVTEGLRTLERQKQLVAQGASRTMKSYHLRGDAIDFYPFYDGKVQVQAPLKMFREIADAFKRASNELGMEITWGGDWKSFVDGPHIQVERYTR